jgi:hypothetical protein
MKHVQMNISTYWQTRPRPGGTVQLARLRYALSAISLLEAGDKDGAVWTADDRRGMRAWVGNMTAWWLDSYLGRSAHTLKNNIGLAYSVVL